MQTSTLNAPARLSQRGQAQRRLRRATARRIYCSTNGCTTFLKPEVSGAGARCPVCGLVRSVGPVGALGTMAALAR